MATIEDLPHKSIMGMDRDEAIELLRQIRLRRRTPEPKKQSKPRPKKVKLDVPTKTLTKGMSKDQIFETMEMAKKLQIKED